VPERPGRKGDRGQVRLQMARQMFAQILSPIARLWAPPAQA
jgi:hypothetical protein